MKHYVKPLRAIIDLDAESFILNPLNHDFPIVDLFMSDSSDVET